MPLAIDYVRLQGEYCARMGSPFYGALLARAADDMVADGPLAAVFAGYAHEPVASAMALRLMGEVHRFVLSGEAPTLAPFYPSVGGDGDGVSELERWRDADGDAEFLYRDELRGSVQWDGGLCVVLHADDRAGAGCSADLVGKLRDGDGGECDGGEYGGESSV